MCLSHFMNMQIKKILHTGLKLFPNARGFQLVFHWVSKPIHLTRIRYSGWVRTAWIINKFEKSEKNRKLRGSEA